MRFAVVAMFGLLHLSACTDGQHVDLAGALLLQPMERRTIQSPRLLEATAPFAEACLLPAAPHSVTLESPYAFHTIEKVSFLPVVSLIGENGNADDFASTSLLHTSEDKVWLCFSAPGRKPNAPYKAITIQTEVVLQLAAVRWQNYDK
jgi:hypothetical protein